MTGIGSGDRPRELRWWHAGPMLFGDWGTSRLYVLGLAFAFTGRASFWFIAAMCLLMVGVGWSYTIACRLFPDGGGVYSAAQRRSQLLAVIGALLLCADYVVTASLSCLEAFHYLGVAHTPILGLVPIDAALAALLILAIGVLNFLGPTKTGTLAMVVALATVGFTLVIAVACVPHLHAMEVESPFARGYLHSWVGFTEIILALSGVEAIANMTGVMVKPVERTAKRAIIPVLTEIVILNLVLAAAMNTLPDTTLFQTKPGSDELLHTGDMLKVIAATYVGPGFAAIAGVCFAALLLSAVNTAIGALVSVLFMLSRDKELPRGLGRLNRYGMPVVPLWMAMIIPALIVLLFPNVESLGGLYAIGIVGAILLNLGSIATNPALDLRKWERRLMLAISVILVCVEITIMIVKPDARGFAFVVLGSGLAARVFTIATHPAVPLTSAGRRWYAGLAVSGAAAVLGFEVLLHNTPIGFLLTVGSLGVVAAANFRVQTHRPVVLHYTPPERDKERARKPLMLPGSYKPKARVMVATQGNPRLLKFAFEEARARQAELQLLFVRHVAVTPMGTVEAPSLEEDEDALALFDRVRDDAKAAGVPLKLLYAVSRDVPDAVLEMAVTHGADLLLLGSTRRGAVWKAMKGDVIQAVAEHLPESVGLLIVA